MDLTPFTVDVGRHQECRGWRLEFRPAGKHWIDFRAWRVMARTGVDAEARSLFGELGLPTGPLDDPTLVEPTARGFVKWDGCSEWEWPTEDWHLCGADDAADRCLLLKTVYLHAGEWFAHQDGLPLEMAFDWPAAADATGVP